jgi:DNA-binding CsgD family transcriptional regulator
MAPPRVDPVATTCGLIGRDRELALLSSLLDRAPEEGAAIVVTGLPGVGKSALLRAAADRARDAGFEVLATTGVESEAQLPFAGLQQLVAPVLDMADALAPAQRSALLSALGAELGPPSEPFLTALATLNLLVEVAAERPMFIGADDVHWLDRPSHEMLSFVARRVGGDQIVLVGSVRPGHSGPFVAAGLAELELGPLDDEAARRVLDATAPDLTRADRDRVLRVALGNPLALVELPAALRSAAGTALDPTTTGLPLTARLERAFAGRVAGLGTATRDTLLVAAVEDADGLAEILAAASLLAGGAVETDALDRAATAGLLDYDGVKVQFRHPLVRTGVLQSETVTRRQAAHAAVADVVTDEPYRRTWHRAQSIVGPDDGVADELEASHTIALRRGSVTSAVWALERSAQLSTDSSRRGARLLAAAEHAFGLGRADMVERLVDAAAKTSLSDLDRAKLEWIREIFSDGVPGDAGRVHELCGIAREAMDAGDADLALDLLLGAALRSWWSDTGPEARAEVAATVERSPGREGDPRYVAALAVSEPLLRGTAVTGLLSHVVLESVGDADALRLLGMAAHAIGDEVRCADFLERAETKLRDEGRLGLLPHVFGLQTQASSELGDWRRAAAAAEEGRRLAAETGQPIWSAGTLVGDARAAALRGDADTALRLAAQAEDAANHAELNDLLACVQLARGFAWASTGAYEDAYEAIRRVFDPSDPSHHQRELFAGIMSLAEAAVHCGRRADARRVLATTERTAEITPSPILHVHLRYARAVLADDGQAEALYQDALGHHLTRWPLARARLELAYGTWLRRQRRAIESRTPLRSAHTIFDIIGAGSWAEQAQTELRAAGARTTARGPTADEVLSPQELLIARLAGAGLSNRQIGQRLYLSHRTVGSHLYRIFPKLGVTSRAQIASRLAGS